MKLIIAGSRTLGDQEAYEELQDALYEATLVWNARAIDEVVTGGAKGVDTLGKNLAKEFNIAHKEFPADWATYGKRAGYRRNVQMASYADALVLLWDGKSKGSGHMLDIAKAHGLLVYERVMS
ncbi:MAG: DUF2493 domain-containing protein [Actinobacteria bacterium]|nr:DUF2493 domain-containing protein [Actinomycetota bacterium]